MERKGRCLCGAVSFVARDVEPKVAACNCGMCRRWTGGPYLSFGSSDVVFEGGEKITTFESSSWAERAFCSVCGSSLYYKVTAPGPHHGRLHIAFGTLDDQGGFDMSVEYFIDRKPAAYSLEGEHRRLTEAEVFALFAAASE